MQFVVLAHPRTGTTEFCNHLLNDHPDIVCVDELFNKGSKGMAGMLEKRGFDPAERYTSPTKFVTAFAENARERSGASCFGYKFFPTQLPHQDSLDVLFQADKVICLRRRNLLQAAVSHAISRATGQSHWRSKADFEASLDIEIIKSFIHTYRTKLDQLLVELHGRQDVQELWYEDLYPNPDISETFEFLGQQPHAIEYEQTGKKLNDESRYLMVENITEIDRLLSSEQNGFLFSSGSSSTDSSPLSG